MVLKVYRIFINTHSEGAEAETWQTYSDIITNMKETEGLSIPVLLLHFCYKKKIFF